jgi:KDO2-lipid IV(A) lauroyltransferase
MKKQTGKIAAILIKLLGKLPFTVIYPLGAALGWLMWIMKSRGSRVALVNIRLCYPELDADSQTKLARSATIENGKTFFEIAAVWGKPYAAFASRIASIEGEERFKSACDSGKGLILVSSHLGNFEILIQYISQYCDPTILYRLNKIPAVNDYMTRQRSRHGAHFVTTSSEGISAFSDALHKNGIIAMAADPEPKPARGSFAPFFNVPALTGHYIIELLRETQADILGIHIARDDNNQFHVYIDEFPAKIRSEDMVEALTALNQVIEMRVRNDSAQYQWGYKRFKRRPNGEKIYN